MRSLIVVAHPEPRSFNGALARAAQEALQSRGHEVRISDLYSQAFAPEEHARHYSRRQNPARFDAQTEQRFSAQQNVLPHDVQGEIDDILWADLLVLQFPLWWFGMPAILKGWMDRVFVYGRLYSASERLHSGVCRGKRALLSVTAGSSSDACAHDGQEGDARLHLWPINYALHYLGFTVLVPALMFGVRGSFAGEDAVARKRSAAAPSPRAVRECRRDAGHSIQCGRRLGPSPKTQAGRTDAQSFHPPSIGMAAGESCGTHGVMRSAS